MTPPDQWTSRSGSTTAGGRLLRRGGSASPTVDAIDGQSLLIGDLITELQGYADKYQAVEDTGGAYRLALGGLRVALLEKGTHLPTDGSTLDVARVVHEGVFLSQERWMDGRGRPIQPEEHFNVGGKTKWYGAALLRYGEHEFSPDIEHGCLATEATAMA